MPKTSILLRFVLLAALLGTAAACGGGSERLSKQELISQGDAICTEYQAKSEEAERALPQVDPTSSSTSDENLRKFGEVVPDLVEILRDQIGELRSLEPPEEDEDRYEVAMDALDSGADRLDEAGEAARDADRAGVRAALTAAQTKLNQADAIARDYGYKVCGSENS